MEPRGTTKLYRAPFSWHDLGRWRTCYRETSHNRCANGMKAMMAGRTNAFERRHARLRGRVPEADRTGFTLVELLVVIAIIALLLALVLPALERVRKKAAALTCQSHLRQWAMALAAYTEDHQGRFPTTMSGTDGIWLLRGALLSGQDTNEPPDSFHHFRSGERR